MSPPCLPGIGGLGNGGLQSWRFEVGSVRIRPGPYRYAPWAATKPRQALLQAEKSVLNVGMQTDMPATRTQPGIDEPSAAGSRLSGYEMHHRRVDPGLGGLVCGIVGYREGGQPLRLSPEMAPLVVPLIISFAAPFEIALGREPSPADRFWSFTSGLYPGFVLINSSGGAECIQIDFTPLGAYRFFGMPMSELAGRIVTLYELGDRGIGELRDRLAQQSDWDRRLEIAEEFVADRLRASRPASMEIAWAYEQILECRGAIRVGEVADRLDWSRKHLNDRFREEVGVGPKSLARMARFNHALTLARDAADCWAGIAMAAGYSDQAHMVREFREFGGITPTSLTPDLFEGRR